MIRLQRDSTTTIALSLSEKTTIVSPVYLFVFTNDSQNVAYPVILADTSTTKGRFNSFDVVESDTSDPVNGVVTLTTGYYNYEVYEQTSATNLDPTLADNTTAIETGKTRVVDNTIQDYTDYTNTDQSVTFYDPNLTPSGPVGIGLQVIGPTNLIG